MVGDDVVSNQNEEKIKFSTKKVYIYTRLIAHEYSGDNCIKLNMIILGCSNRWI